MTSPQNTSRALNVMGNSNINIIEVIGRKSYFSIRHPFYHAKLKTEWQHGRLANARKAFQMHKCVYVHIPKCAGNSVAEGIFGPSIIVDRHMTLWAYQMVLGPLEYRGFWKFTIVRNPWDRLLSAYLFLKNGGFNKFDNDWAQSNLAQYRNFREFVIDWVNIENCRSWVHFIPQNEFLRVGGKVQIDFVGRFESLEEDFQKICNHLNICRDLPKVNTNPKRSGHYREYYDEETLQIVKNVYLDDIEQFNYEF
jgi:hypothetical protein